MKRPEHQVDKRPTLREKVTLWPVTALVAVINIVVFTWAESVGDTRTTETLLAFGASQREAVWSGDFWRLVTPMFLHIGPLHLAWNLWAMLAWCALSERALGHFRFAVGYLLSGIGGTALSLLMHDVVAAGASGAGFGVIGIVLVLMYRRAGSVRKLWRQPGINQTLFGVGLWLGLGFFAVRMDNFAHIGGLVTGLLFALSVTTQKPKHRLLLGLAVGAGVVGVASLTLVRGPWFF
jgi:rhomboid protease GluP